VMVRFRWDRLGALDDQCSCWARVSQVMAGAGWGAQWIPRAGQEVIVSFEQGNPDRPLITGCLHHAHHLPPFGLPGKKTRSGFRTSSTPGGKGYNELSFEDQAGAEVVRLRAQRDMRVRVGADQVTTVRKDQNVNVEEGNRILMVNKGSLFEHVEDRRTSFTGKGRLATIEEGGDELTLVRGNRKVSVQNGDHVLMVSGSALTRVSKGSHTIEVDGPTLVLRCGKSELIMERDGSISLVGSRIQIKANSAVDVTGQTIKLNG